MLGQLYGARQSKVYVGTEAREDRFKAEGKQARVLHFATHGILNNASPMYSHLALAEGAKSEDGLLEAWELMQLDLRADFAVLSACDTARGRFGAGEGMIGLTWAMFMAGVPAIVVSQWKVESASTRDLMLSFHSQLKAQSSRGTNGSKAEALRQAALKVMNPPNKPPILLGRLCTCRRGSAPRLGAPVSDRPRAAKRASLQHKDSPRLGAPGSAGL